MRSARRLVFPALILAVPALLFGRNRQISQIDEYCERVNAELSSTKPLLFAGPDPWTEADDRETGDPPDVLAYVYTAGPQIRRVFLRVTDEDDGWREDIVY